MFQSGGNYLVVRLAGKSVGRVKSLDEVRATIADQLRADGEQSYYADKKSEVLLSVNGIRYTLGDLLDEYIRALPADLAPTTVRARTSASSWRRSPTAC